MRSGRQSVPSPFVALPLVLDDGPVGIVATSRFHQRLGLGHEISAIAGNIALFTDIRLQVIKLDWQRRAVADGFPVAETQRLNERGFVQFPRVRWIMC